MATKTLTITLAGDEAARAAYEVFVARNAQPKPWEALSELVHDSWRAVARAVLGHVTAKETRP